MLANDSSDPSSPNYAKHWTAEEVVDMFKPSDDTVSAVKEWLTSFGIAGDRIAHSDNKGWLAFDASAEEVESLLRTEFHAYEHKDSGNIVPACEQ